MEEKKEDKTKKKGGNKAGVRTQKLFTFRIDQEAAEYISGEANKGRLINELIIQWGKKNKKKL